MLKCIFLILPWVGERDPCREYRRDSEVISAAVVAVFRPEFTAETGEAEYQEGMPTVKTGETLRSVFIPLLDWSRSHPRVSPPAAERLGAHVSRDEVGVAHPSGTAEEVCQTVSDTRGCVTGTLLLASTQSESRLHWLFLLQQALDYVHALLTYIYSYLNQGFSNLSCTVCVSP